MVLMRFKYCMWCILSIIQMGRMGRKQLRVFRWLIEIWKIYVFVDFQIEIVIQPILFLYDFKIRRFKKNYFFSSTRYEKNCIITPQWCRPVFSYNYMYVIIAIN